MDRKIITNIVGTKLERAYFTPSENKETEGIHNLLLNFDNGNSISIDAADRSLLIFVESGRWEMIPAESETYNGRDYSEVKLESHQFPVYLG